MLGLKFASTDIQQIFIGATTRVNESVLFFKLKIFVYPTVNRDTDKLTEPFISSDIIGT